MRSFINLVNSVSRFFGVVAALAIVGAVILTCEMIFIRYFIGASTYWHTEAVVYLMLGATLLGLPYVQTLKGHVSVDIIPIMLPPVGRKCLLLFSLGMAIIVLAIMTFYAAELTFVAYAKNWTSETVWGPPLWIPYSLVPIGCGLFSLQLLADGMDIWLTPADGIVVEGGSH